MNPLDEMFKKVNGLVPENFKRVQEDIEHNMKAMLQSQLVKMDLVTREEFDVQKAVLQKTRQKVDDLEGRIKALEAHLLKDEH